MPNVPLIVIDGSLGEGGGQILRTSLSLSLVTGKPFRLVNIRAHRKHPGLLAQHLTAVQAAARISTARVEGVAIGAREIVFAPDVVRPGQYRFAVGTAGSATLVFQTILPALMTADTASELILEGGTHNPWAPSFDFLQRAFLPLIGRMGPQIDAVLERPGFYPAGGGRFRVHLSPRRHLQRLELLERGPIGRQSARAVVSRLPLSIAQREIRTIQERLGWPADWTTAETVDALGPGNVVLIEIESQHVTEVFTGFGRKGIPAERVAGDVARQAERYLAADAPVGENLADQLLIPLAMAGGGVFHTLALSSHTQTNIEVLQHFLDAKVSAERLAEDLWQVSLA
jgi:RNA 3'-terminal phosphate cyclase (ATP)